MVFGLRPVSRRRGWTSTDELVIPSAERVPFLPAAMPAPRAHRALALDTRTPREACVARWDANVAEWERIGICPDHCRLVRSILADFDQAFRDEQGATLTPAQAAEVSRYSADHLKRLIRDGKIPNAGRPNAPLIRRSDLPLRPSARLQCTGPTAQVSATRRTVDSVLTTLKRSA